jgi:gamma-glutamyltranspeptidase/glutathione hydrolase
MVVAGHPLAAQAGFQEAGGNAIDAGVAVGLAINVLESEMTCFAGVAPSMIRMGATGVVQNFVGVGPWPRALDAEYFHKHQGGLVPEGILNTVVPGSPESRTRGRRGGRSNTCRTRPRDTMLAGPEMARRISVHHPRRPIE